MLKFHPLSLLAVACVACVACGGTFTANGGGGGGGSETGGNAGEASGGQPSSAGSSSAGDAGEPGLGGTGSAGEPSVAGAGAGGSVGGRGGAGRGGFGPGAGSGGAGADCAKLRQQYQAAVEKARVCDKGSTDQCSASSVAEPVGCGCPVLVNAKSEHTAVAKKAYQAYEEGNCDFGGVNCDIYCAPVLSASCAQQSMGPGSSFVCTGGIPL